MFKRILFSFVFICSSSSLYSQYFGLTAGVNVPKWKNDNSTFNTGFNVGLKFESDLAPSFFVEGSLLFSKQGLAYKSKRFFELDHEDKIDLWYVKLPVNLGYRFRINRSMSVAPKGGVFGAVGVKGKDHDLADKNWAIGNDDLDPFKNYTDLSKNFENYKRGDFGLALGLNFLIAEHVELSAGYEFGMVSIWEYGKTFGIDGDKTRNLYVNLAYLF